MADITITINQSDSYGDGWQGQWVRIFNSEGVQLVQHQLEDGVSGSDTFTLPDGASYTWSFGGGVYIDESSFTMVRDDTGEVLAQANGAAASGSFTLEAAAPVDEPSGDEESPESPEYISRYSFESDMTAHTGDDGTSSGVTFDGAANFANGAYAEIPHNAEHNFDSSVTVMCWFKTQTTGLQQVWIKGYAPENGDHQSAFSMTVDHPSGQTGGRLNLVWQDSSGSHLRIVATPDPITDNVWHHAVGIWDGSNIQLYLDGSLVAETATTGTIAPTLPLQFGRWYHPNYGGHHPYNGAVDDFRIYPASMTGEAVAAIYAAGRDVDLPSEPQSPAYTIDMLAVSTDAPSGAVGFEKGDEEAFFISSQSPYSVYFYIAGAWDHHDGGLFSIGMTFAWPDGATRAYVQGSAAGQNVFKSVREIEDGYMYDTDDPDNVIDKFKTTGTTFDVSEHQVSVSGTDDIVLGVASDFVQIIEGDALSHDYTVQVGAATTVSPPEGKDGTSLLIRIFKAES